MPDSTERKRQRRRERAEKDARRRLHPYAGLPMPHATDAQVQVGLDEQAEFNLRTERHERKNPEYRRGWNRPSLETARAAVAYLETLDGWPREAFEALHEDPDTRALLAVVALDHAVQTGRYWFPSTGQKRIRARALSITSLASAVARLWSPAFRDAVERSHGSSLGQMAEQTLRNTQRDFLLLGIHLDRLWDFAVCWDGINRNGTALYRVHRQKTQRGEQTTIRLTVTTISKASKPFEEIMMADPTYGPGRTRDMWRLILGDEDVKPARGRRHVAGGVEFNQVPTGDESDEVVAALESARLRFNVAEFLKDYRRVRATVPGLEDAARQVRAQLNYDGKGKMPEELRDALHRRDEAEAFEHEFLSVYEQVRKMSPEEQTRCTIRTAAYRIINRRFESTGCWPQRAPGHEDLTVEGQADMEYIDDHGDENTATGALATTVSSSPRGRWFMAEDGERLAGLDISSSQSQIFSILIQDADLEHTMRGGDDGTPLKRYLADLAWAHHKRHGLLVEGRKVGERAIEDYSGPEDKALQELMKLTWMRTGYGSTVAKVVLDQNDRPRVYGPGWLGYDRAEAFLDTIPGYKELLKFRDAMRDLGTNADPYLGLEMVDPLGVVTYHWAPLLTGTESIQFSNSGMRLWFFPPGKMVPLPKPSRRLEFVAFTKTDMRDGRYPVHVRKLKNAATPCLIHSLDGYYAALVVRGLVAKGVTSFASVHDCWLLPQSQIGLLKTVLDEAADAWLAGLGPVYAQVEKLLRGIDHDYLPQWVGAYERWRLRVKSGPPVRFNAKPSDLIEERVQEHPEDDRDPSDYYPADYNMDDETP